MSHHTPERLLNAWPTGAIRTSAQLLDLVIEARKEKRAIRIFAVEQSGALREFFLHSHSRLVRNKNTTGMCVGPAYDEVSVYVRYYNTSSTKPKDRYYKKNILCGSYNLDNTGSGNCHRLFENRRLAVAYSEALQNDEEYMTSVKAWHAYCSRAFAFYKRF